MTCAVALTASALAHAIADPIQILQPWFNQQTNVVAWSADFIQIRTLPTFNRPLQEPGHVDYKSPGYFRWVIGSPPRTIVLGQPSEMTVAYPFLNQVEHYPLGPAAPRQWRDMISLMQAGMPRDQKDFLSQFKILSLTNSTQNWIVQMQPTHPEARQMIPHLDITLNTRNFLLVSTRLVFADGTTMESRYTNQTLNPSLPDSLFQWKSESRAEKSQAGPRP